MINRNFRDFKFQHKRKLNQVLFTSEKIRGDAEILNLINNFFNEKNSFIFESVEKGIIKTLGLRILTSGNLRSSLHLFGIFSIYLIVS